MSSSARRLIDRGRTKTQQMELTTQQKARIFAMYIGCMVKYPDYNSRTGFTAAKLTSVGFDEIATTCLRKRKGVAGDILAWESNGHHDTDALHAKLILRPLSAITDEDKMRVVEILYNDSPGGWYIKCTAVHPSTCAISRIEYDSFRDDGIEHGFGHHLLKDIDFNNVLVFQFLVSRGYAVPLFIAPGHALNGKTGIEMGIAIDSTTL